MRARVSAAAVAAALVVGGCASRAQSGSDAKPTMLRAAVSVQSNAEQVAKVTLTAWSSTSLYVVDLYKDPGNGWSGGVQVEPGEYFMQADAFDAGGDLLYQGSAGWFSVSTGQTTWVALVAQSVKPPISYGNTPPKITSVYVSSLNPDPGETVRLIVAAYDPDPGSVLAFSWSATDGAFDDAAAPRTKWTAPGTDGYPSLTVTVTDEKGASAQASFQLKVGNPVGDLAAQVYFNSPPDVLYVTANPTQVEVGQGVWVWAEASDPDGDMLSYDWYSNCYGSWSYEGASAVFYPYEVPAGGRCDVWVYVYDWNGGYNSSRTAFWVGPPPAPKVLPTQIVNGSFEDDYAGWTLWQPVGGQWDVTQGISCATPSGVRAPLTINPGELVFDYGDQVWVPQWSPFLPITFTPSDGECMAFMLDNGRGVTRLYQDLEIPPGATTLEWDMMYTNHLGAWVLTGTDRQFLAVNVHDITTDKVAGGIYRTPEDAPSSIPMTHFEADISAWAGQAVRLNFTLFHYQYYFDLAIDNVQLH